MNDRIDEMPYWKHTPEGAEAASAFSGNTVRWQPSAPPRVWTSPRVHSLRHRRNSELIDRHQRMVRIRRSPRPPDSGCRQKQLDTLELPGHTVAEQGAGDGAGTL